MKNIPTSASSDTPVQSPVSRRRLVIASTLGSALIASGTAAWAQSAASNSSSSRPLVLVVPAPPGGTADISARMLAEPLGKILGTSVTVENRAGGNGIIAGQQIARGAADASALLVQYSGFHCITPLLQPIAGFDPEKDLKPVGHLIDAPQLLAVRANFPAATFDEFIRYAKANPGKINYASSGNGSLQHVTTELLKDLTKTFMVHIPYRGTGQALNDLLAGTVDFTITTPPPLLPHIRSGKLRALMVTGSTRSAVLPDVPTALERGVNLTASSWFAVFGPNAMSAEALARISGAIRQVVESEAFKKRAEEQGAKAVYMSSDTLAKLAVDERLMWQRIIKVSGIKAD